MMIVSVERTVRVKHDMYMVKRQVAEIRRIVYFCNHGGVIVTILIYPKYN